MAGYATPAWADGVAPAISAAALTAMGQGIELGQHPYGVCDTAMAEAAKTVALDYSGTLALFAGLTVRVRFVNGSTAYGPTLNVNGTGAYPIRAASSSSGNDLNSITVGSVLQFTFDGTDWIFNGFDAFDRTATLDSATRLAFRDKFEISPQYPTTALSLLCEKMPLVAAGSYTGDGTYGAEHPTVFSLSFAPKLLIVSPNDRTAAVIFFNGMTRVLHDFGGNAVYLDLVWSAGGVSVYAEINSAEAQFNKSGQAYRYFAIG